MGLNWHGVKFLAHIRRDGADFPRVITIGRLNLHVPMPKVRQLLDECQLPHTLNDQDVLSAHLYAEPVFKLLGAHTVDSMDASSYEQATIVADLNRPIPTDLHGKYDMVYDGGTIEHVFDVPQALKNLMSLPKVGGHVIIQTMANNWLGHGFYQFSPELFYRVFTPENGYRVERIVLHGAFEFARWYDVPDPAEVRGRIELANNWHGLLLLVHAKREAIVPIFEKPPQQSDYSARWESGEPHHSAGTANSGRGAATILPARPALKRRIIGSLKETFPWTLRLKHKLLLAMPGIPRLVNSLKHRRERRRFSVEAQPDKFRPMD